MAIRSTREVLEDHLRLRRVGDLETDLARNYAAGVVLLCQFGIFRGSEQVRAAAERIGLLLPKARFADLASHVDGEMAFLEWAAEADGVQVLDGADSYLIRNGLIRAQTIYHALVSQG